MEVESDEDNYEEEEYLVYADFESNLMPNELEDPNLQVKIIGIDSEHPIAEINGKIFKGTVDFSIGTHVLFAKNEEPPVTDPLFDVNPSEMYKLFAKTNKIIKMKRIFVENKENSATESREDTFEEIVSRLEVNSSYGEALNELLPPGALPPRQTSPDRPCSGNPYKTGDEDDPDYVPGVEEI